jgi:hypothetical protein
MEYKIYITRVCKYSVTEINKTTIKFKGLPRTDLKVLFRFKHFIHVIYFHTNTKKHADVRQAQQIIHGWTRLHRHRVIYTCNFYHSNHT